MRKTAKEAERCGECGRIIDKREIVLPKFLALALWKVFLYCKQQGVTHFRTRDIRHLIGPVAYSKFPDWTYFSTMVVRVMKGHYMIDMGLCEQFFLGRVSIPYRVVKDPLTGEITFDDKDLANIFTLPGVKELLDSDGNFQAVYRDRDEYAFPHVDPSSPHQGRGIL